jgi:hypothetical protein
MKYTEAVKLKVGDLVIIDNRNKHYGGLILEIDSINPTEEMHCCRVTLKQPGFSSEFCIENYDTRHLKKYEP